MIEGKVTLTLSQPDGRQFVAESGSGHHMILDDAQGKTGPKPIELVAMAFAGCTAFDVITILRNKQHRQVASYEVKVEAEQNATPPRVFTHIGVHHIVRGDDIDEQGLAHAIHLSETKYCSVGAMLRMSGAQVTTTYEVLKSQPALDLAGAV